MANLLPQQYRDMVRNERRIRVAIILCVSLTITASLGVIFLLPSALYSQSKSLDAELSLEVTKQLVAQRESGNVLTKVRRTRNQIERLESEFKDVEFSDVLKVIYDSMPQDVELRAVSYTRIFSEPDTIKIDGVANTREALLTFTRQLDRQELLANIDLPVSNLAKSFDIGFSLELKTSQPNTDLIPPENGEFKQETAS